MLKSFQTPIRLTARSYSSTRFLKEFMTTKEKGPVQVSIETKVSQSLNPSILELLNESHLHAHHAAMKGNTNKETHFKMVVVSDNFQGKSLMQRHRMVYGLLTDELQNQGLHALSISAKTPEEIEKRK
ncbi:bola-like protein-domain-containing protein [Sporodiniella umbellata]|nr:bola-like protein-domain-containing protein [Sporodiniella umbellata]